MVKSLTKASRLCGCLGKASVKALANSIATTTNAIRPYITINMPSVFLADLMLPMLCLRRAFDLPVQIGRDPAAIKIARLRHHA